MLVTRSKPMPVSTCFAGSGENVPSGFALNWMKTRFQISMQRASPLLTSEPLVSPPGVRSTWISEHGPHGPVSPIIQKLSFLPPVQMWTLGSSPAAVKSSRPMVVGFLVEFGRLAFARLIDGGVEAFRRKPEPFLRRDEFPRPFDGFLFEIIAKAPVAEHLEKRVVIGVEADVFEVVVFAAGADAFLGVGGAPGFVGALGPGRERWARTGSCRRW